MSTTLPYVRGSGTSYDAACSMEESASAIRTRVYVAIANAGIYGMTCDEAEVALRLRHQTCSARFSELHQQRRIVKTEFRRPTRSGRGAAVYVARRRMIQTGKDQAK